MRRLDEALINKSIYCYDNGVLMNKLDIKDQDELDKVEATLTYLRLNMLSEKHPKFKFDVDYYLSIHAFIFQDIYSFAGEIRSENISKSIPFCRPEFIYQQLKYLLEEMKKRVKSIKSVDDYIEYLSYYLSEINLVHPFREGNGRTQREFFRQLVEFLNDYLPLPPMKIDYSNVTKQDRSNLINGCINSVVSNDFTLLKEFFKSVLYEKEIVKDDVKTV